jgi:hypothetical protein
MDSRRKYLKLSFDGKVKRATLFCDFDNFKTEACSLFNKDFEDEAHEFLYLDDEDDIIQLESQADYDQALLYLFNSNNKTLKIRIVPRFAEEYNKDYTKLLIDSLYTKRINELNEELESLSYEPKESDLLMCSRCNRRFNNESYYKHIKVCWRVFQTKRIPFNSRRKRLTREQLLFSLVHRDDNKVHYEQESRWKEQSEEFRRYIKELKERNNNNNCCPYKKFKKHESKRNPFDSRAQRLSHLGEVQIPEFEKKQKKWKQLSHKFRAVIKLSKMLRN